MIPLVNTLFHSSWPKKAQLHVYTSHTFAVFMHVQFISYFPLSAASTAEGKMASFSGLDVTTLLIGAAVAIAIYYWYQSYVNHYWKRKNVPSVDPQFFLGLSTFLKGKNMWDQDLELCKKYGKICGFYFKRAPALLVSDPELIRLILVKDFQSFPSKRANHSPGSFLGKMLVFLHGEEWKRMRSILTPVFTSGKMRKLASLVNKCSESVTDAFLKFADSKTPVELRKQYVAFSLDVIASTAFGTELDTCQNPDNIFATHAHKVQTNAIKWKLFLHAISPKLFTMLGLVALDVNAMGFFRELVLKIREQRIKGGKVRKDFLQMLLDLEKDTGTTKEKDDHGDEGGDEVPSKQNFKKSLTTEEIVAQCTLFFLAGLDTAGNVICMASYLLALNPECQERLLAEVDQTWEKHEGKIDFDVVSSMKYLDAVIAETLRLYPPGTRLKRLCHKDYELGDTGITIPKGMLVYIPTYAMHRDPEYYPEPEKFNPERFLPENKDSIQPYTYLPFGSGPRNCIAMRFGLMEVKLGLVNVLRHVSFHKCPETETQFEFSKFDEGTLFQPKSVTVAVKRRR